MIHGVRYIRQDVGYLSKKHDCPICHGSLRVVKCSEVTNSNSEEAKRLPPIIPKTVIGSRGVKFRSYNAVGNIQWIWKEFECPSCHRRFTVEQMKQLDGAPKERWKELISSFDEPSGQISTEELETITEDGQKKCKLALLIAIPLIVVVLLVAGIGIALSSSSDFVDTNGADNFALTEITREDILSLNSNYSASMVTQKSSGYHTNIVGRKLRDSDRDHISKSFGRINGVIILQATKISGDTLTLTVKSTVTSGNAEIVILIDGEYYCSVDVNQARSVTLKDVSNKEVVVKLAGENAKISVEVNRAY